MFCFLYGSIQVGGAQLLIYKMSKYLCGKGLKSMIICQSISDTMRREAKKNQIDVIVIQDVYNYVFLQSVLKKFEAVICITCEPILYMAAKAVAHPNKKTICYIVHPYIFGKKENGLSRSLLKNALKRQILKMGLRHNDILFMDELCAKQLADIIPENLTSIDQDTMIRISIEIPEVSMQSIEDRAQNKKIRILAVARADFPFKGYLLGLVNRFPELRAKVDCSLDIISYGKDINLLQECIDRLPKSLSKDVKLYGETPYDELPLFFQKAKVYVGMGTSLLDAGIQGVISIPVESYTLELHAKQFFHEDYRVLGYLHDGGSFDNFIELIQQVARYTVEEYLEISNITRNLVIEHYSLHNNMQKILHHVEMMSLDRGCNKLLRLLLHTWRIQSKMNRSFRW